MNDIDLAGMLADAMANGVYYVDAGGRERLADAARALEFEVFGIDLAGCSDRDAVMSRLTAALDLPDWFGGNWDALSDCLNDLSWRPADGYVLLLEHAHDWQVRDEAGFETFLEIASDAAEAWSRHGVPFWLLVMAPPGAIATADPHAGDPLA